MFTVDYYHGRFLYIIIYTYTHPSSCFPFRGYTIHKHPLQIHNKNNKRLRTEKDKVLWNLFVNLQLSSLIFEINIYYINPLVLAFPKCGLLFLRINSYRRMLIRFTFKFIKQNQNCLRLELEISYLTQIYMHCIDAV